MSSSNGNLPHGRIFGPTSAYKNALLTVNWSTQEVIAGESGSGFFCFREERNDYLSSSYREKPLNSRASLPRMLASALSGFNSSLLVPSFCSLWVQLFSFGTVVFSHFEFTLVIIIISSLLFFFLISTLF